MKWFRKWWGEDKPKSWFDYPYNPPHWSAKPLRTILEGAKKGSELPWFQRPFGVLIVAVVGAVMAAGIAKKLGWI